MFAIGSGSKPNRRSAVLLALNADGSAHGPPRAISLQKWFTRLQREFGEVNLEGAFIQGENLTLLQRGNKSSPRNACVRIALAPVLDAIAKRRALPAPKLAGVTDFELGAFDDAPLCFTDGAALPAGGFVFTAVAEATEDSYADGECVGAAIGIIDSEDRLRALWRLDPRAQGRRHRSARDWQGVGAYRRYRRRPRVGACAAADGHAALDQLPQQHRRRCHANSFQKKLASFLHHGANCPCIGGCGRRRARGSDTPLVEFEQGLSGRCRFLRQILGRALRDDAPAAGAPFGPEIDYPVGFGDHVEVVLDDDHGIAAVDQPMQHPNQFVDVGHVQADGGLIEHVERLRRALSSTCQVVAHLR